MAPFLDALTPLVDVFETLGVAYYIGGSLASIAHGIPRTTLDVDLIAEIRPDQVRPLVAQVQSSYYVQAADILEAIQHRSSFNLVHLASMIKVDVFLAPDRPFDHAKAQRARPGQIITSDPRPFRLTSPIQEIVGAVTGRSCIPARGSPPSLEAPGEGYARPPASETAVGPPVRAP